MKVTVLSLFLLTSSSSAFSIARTSSSLHMASSTSTTALFSTTSSTTTTTTTNKNVGAIGSKLTDLELAKEALSKYFDDVDSISLTPTTGGVNNIVQYVDLPNGQRELLRIYNNGCDYQRVKFEHAILEQLNDNPKIQMSFRVPKFLQAKRDTTGDMSTVVRLSNGADACMCELIPGTLPKLTCARDLGRAAGELNTALTQVSVDRSMCNVAPYYDMWGVHHAVTEENFIETMRSNLFDETRDAADRMLQETLDIAEKCTGKYQNLPVQLIHGDLHYDNVLVDNDKVSALLDFEFASFDWRALELAIGLSKYAGEEPDAMPYFDDYIDGYAETGVLTRPEAEAIPDLINLRILSNVVYFVGRHLAGEDDISSITTRIENYARRVDWVKNNADVIVQRIVDKMKCK